MHAPGNRDSSIRTGRSGWISIHINDAERGLDLPGEQDTKAVRGNPIHLFENAQRASLPERYPRLAFLAIAIALLVTALAAEFDYLKGAGYFWP